MSSPRSPRYIAKFRNVYGSAAKPRNSYTDIKNPLTSGESDYVKANPKFFAYGGSSGGAPVYIRKLSEIGRIPSGAPKIATQKGKLTDFDFHPFINNIIATGSDDCSIAITKFPKNGLTQTITKSTIQLKGHAKKICLLSFNPSANNILASTSYDSTCKIWDIETSTCITTYKKAKGCLYSINWKIDGSLLTVTGRDKKLRIFDPRKNDDKESIIIDAFDGVKTSKAVFLPKFNFIGATGFTKGAVRQLKLWDLKKITKKPLAYMKVDGSGVLCPKYDNDLNIIFLAGKGASTINYWEITNDEKIFYPLLDYRDVSPQKGGSWLPKRGLETMKGEIQRYLKLTKNSIVPISFIVPRKSYDIFHSDIYPDCISSKPGLTAKEWIKGNNKEAIRMSLDPEKRNDDELNDENKVLFEKKKKHMTKY